MRKFDYIIVFAAVGWFSGPLLMQLLFSCGNNNG